MTWKGTSNKNEEKNLLWWFLCYKCENYGIINLKKYIKTSQEKQLGILFLNIYEEYVFSFNYAY